MTHISLPLEMLQAIVHEIPAFDIDELLTLRLVDRTFHSIVKDKAFRYFRLQNTLTSARHLDDFLQSSSELIRAVERIRVAQPETADDEEENHFSILIGTPKFPAVKSIEISLPNTAVAYRRIDVSLILTLLEIVPPSIQSLTLTNWVPRHSDQYRAKHFPTNPLLLPLHSLKELSVAVQSHDCKDRSYTQPNNFWQLTLPKYILSPTQSTLTSLNLASDMHFSLAYLDWAALFFPHLEVLSLRGFLFSITFYPPTDLEHFILKHKRTLRSLELHKCTILRMYQCFRSWEEVWLCFAAELDVLQELVVNEYEPGEFVSYYEGDTRLLRYTVNEPCPRLIPDDAISVDWDWEADAEALEDLKAIVEFRQKLRLSK